MSTNNSGALALIEKRQNLEVGLNAMRERLDALLPAGSHTTSARIVAIVLDATSRDTSLLECTKGSILRAVAQSAEVGLEIASPLGHAYLVPFKNWKANYRKEAQWIGGYKGYVQLALNGNKVRKIEARLVRDADKFDYDLGTSPKIVHHVDARMSSTDRGAVIAAYACAFFGDGSVQFEVMDREELDKVKTDALKKTRSQKNPNGAGPWIEHEGEMLRKTPVRRLTKLIELTPLLAKAVAFDNLSDEARGLFDNMKDGRVDQLKRTLKAQGAPVQIHDGELEDS